MANLYPAERELRRRTLVLCVVSLSVSATPLRAWSESTRARRLGDGLQGQQKVGATRRVSLGKCPRLDRATGAFELFLTVLENITRNVRVEGQYQVYLVSPGPSYSLARPESDSELI